MARLGRARRRSETVVLRKSPLPKPPSGTLATLRDMANSLRNFLCKLQPPWNNLVAKPPLPPSCIETRGRSEVSRCPSPPQHRRQHSARSSPLRSNSGVADIATTSLHIEANKLSNTLLPQWYTTYGERLLLMRLEAWTKCDVAGYRRSVQGTV